MPLPLKPGESPETLAHLYEHRDPLCEIPNCSCCPELTELLKAYGDRRGEEERAKALEEAATGIESYSLGALKAIIPDLRAAAVAKILADSIRHLAAAPSGDARRHWADCAMNHGGAECDMGPDCGAPSGDAKGK